MQTLDIQEQFRDAIADAGITPPIRIIADGRLHRFSSNGKPNDDAGWYALHDGGIAAGAFGCWRLGINEKWRADIGRSLTPQEEADRRAAVEAIMRDAEAKAASKRAAAASIAAWTIENAVPASPDHPYLARKGIQANGVLEKDRELVIPMCDADGSLHSFQTIAPDGQKRFRNGGRKKGCLHMLGEPTDHLFIAEGFATAASVFEATGVATAVAFDTGNLLPVAEALRGKYPTANITIAADDDPSGIGAAKATEAARSIGGVVALPDWGGERPEGATDFNDLARTNGRDAVSASLAKAKPPNSTKPELALVGGYEKIVLTPAERANCTDLRTLMNASDANVEIVPAAPLPDVGRCPSESFAKLVGWISATYGLDERGATAAAVFVTAALASRRYRERSDLYAVACGPEDARTRVARVVVSILRGVGCPHLLREQRIGTVAALHGALSKLAARAYVALDLAVQAETSRRQNNGSFEHVWGEMGDRLPYAVDIRIDDAGEIGGKRGEQAIIHAPALSMLAAVDETRIDSLFNGRSAASKLIEGAMWFDVGVVQGGARRAEVEHIAIADWVVARAVQVRPEKGGPECVKGNLQDVFTDCATEPPHFTLGRDGTLCDEALAILGDGELGVADVEFKDHDRRNARRIAVAVAAWDSPDSPSVTAEVVAWARRLVERGIVERVAHDKKQANDDGRRSVRAKVLEAVEKAGQTGLLRSRLPGVIRSYRDLDLAAREKIVEALHADEDLFTISGPRGAPKLYAAKFVQIGASGKVRPLTSAAA